MMYPLKVKKKGDDFPWQTASSIAPTVALMASSTETRDLHGSPRDLHRSPLVQCINVCMYVCMYACMYVCTYVLIYHKP